MIPAGATQAQVTFTVVNDDIDEVDEEGFGLQLQLVNSPAGVILGQSQGTITITDDDREYNCYIIIIFSEKIKRAFLKFSYASCKTFYLIHVMCMETYHFQYV